MYKQVGWGYEASTFWMVCRDCPLLDWWNDDMLHSLVAYRCEEIVDGPCCCHCYCCCIGRTLAVRSSKSLLTYFARMTWSLVAKWPYCADCCCDWLLLRMRLRGVDLGADAWSDRW